MAVTNSSTGSCGEERHQHSSRDSTTNTHLLDSSEETKLVEDGQPVPLSSASSVTAQTDRRTEKEKLKEKLNNLFIQNIPPQAMYVMTVALGILCAVSVYQSCRDPSHSKQAIALLESLEKYGYSYHDNHQVKKHSFGSPDLLTEDLKKKFVASWSHRILHSADGSVKKVGRDESTEAETSGMRGRKTWKCPELQYVVVFDAGSSGTRLHVYQFQCKDNVAKLLSEVFQAAKPGLSEYVNHPDHGAASLHPMISAALEKVPSSLYSATPLIFKATAGFRLLNASGANGILTKVRERFATTDFSFDADNISIMSDTEEGLCGWITINFLLEKLDDRSVTAAALDLGGASIQITYMPENRDQFTEDLHQLELMGSSYTLYTYSYLGLGLLAARNSTLENQGDGTLKSDCLPVKYSGIFAYGGQNYTVRGPDAPSLDRCWKQVGQFLSSRHIQPPWDLIGNRHDPDVYLFSYFYDTLQWAGVIGNETEKIVSIEDFYHAAEKACGIQYPKKPFLCQDLIYVSRLLGEAFMFWDKPLHVVSEINSWETSWALGAALGALSEMET